MISQNPYAGNALNNWGWATTLPVDSDIYHDIEIEFFVDFTYGIMNHETNPFRIKWVYETPVVPTQPSYDEFKDSPAFPNPPEPKYDLEYDTTVDYDLGDPFSAVDLAGEIKVTLIVEGALFDC